MKANIVQNNLAAKVIQILPFLLFFPIGMVYMGFFIFLLAWVIDGNFQKKWNTIRSDALFPLIFLLMLVLAINALFLSSEVSFRWSSLIHYQIFLFYLIFASLGFGGWQRKCMNIFIVGAIFGSTLLYLAHFSLLPNWSVFKNYAQYSGNKSISIGIFLAIGAAWLLNHALNSTNKRSTWMGIAGFAYIAVAVLFFAKTRTGMLLVFVLSLLVIVRHLKFNFRSFTLAISLLLLPLAIWNLSTVVKERSLSTIESIRAFSGGEMGTGQGNRLQFIVKTGEMIMEKPMLGHGVGSWLEQYPTRAQGLETAQMTTPHNDYLLYTSELGLVGLLALLGVFGRLLITSLRTGGARGMQLLVISVALIIGSAFNAILRDWKFGLPMMLLLAVAMTNDRHAKLVKSIPVVKN